MAFIGSVRNATGWTAAYSAVRPEVPPGPDGELHHTLVSVDGSTNRTMKVPQLRNVYDKVGFTTFETRSLAGFGFFHDGTVPTIEEFVAVPAFDVRNDGDVADINPDCVVSPSVPVSCATGTTSISATAASETTTECFPMIRSACPFASPSSAETSDCDQTTFTSRSSHFSRNSPKTSYSRCA